MSAGTGVFLVVATWTVREIELELLDHRRGVGGHFELNDGGELLSFRKHSVGDQRIAFLGKRELRGRAPIAGDDGGGLFREGHRLEVVVDECQLHFAIFGHEKFNVRLDREQDTSAIRAGHGFVMTVTVVIFAFHIVSAVTVVVIMVMIVVAMRVIVVSVIMGMIVVVIVFAAHNGNGCRSQQDGEQVSYFQGFHNGESFDESETIDGLTNLSAGEFIFLVA